MYIHTYIQNFPSSICLRPGNCNTAKAIGIPTARFYYYLHLKEPGLLHPGLAKEKDKMCLELYLFQKARKLTSVRCARRWPPLLVEM